MAGARSRTCGRTVATTGKHFVHQGPDCPQRMIFPHPGLRRQIIEHLTLLMSYASFTLATIGSQKRSSFSAAC